jgi:hypothetical protein
MSIQQQVSRAIRILRGNRDVSARASHLVVQKDQLMTYESVFKGQAEMKKFFKSTFSERKIMSTKTSFKRIAAVAAVALTLGGFSAVSAHASVNAPVLYHSSDASIAASAYSDVASDVSNIAVGSTAKYGLQSSFVASQAGDTTTVVVSLTQNVSVYPNTNAALPAQTLGVTTGAGYGNAGATNSNTNTAISADGMTVSVGSKAAGLVLGSFYSSFTPTLAGTYVVTYTSTGAITHTWTINVYSSAATLAAATTDIVPVASTTTSIIAAGDTTTVGAADVAQHQQHQSLLSS